MRVWNQVPESVKERKGKKRKVVPTCPTSLYLSLSHFVGIKLCCAILYIILYHTKYTTLYYTILRHILVTKKKKLDLTKR